MTVAIIMELYQTHIDQELPLSIVRSWNQIKGVRVPAYDHHHITWRPAQDRNDEEHQQS